MDIYFCTNGCHVTNKDKGRCPSCRQWLKKTDSRSAEQLQKNIEQMQQEAAQDFAKGRLVRSKL